MDHGKLLEYCMKKNGAYIDYPFGPDCTVVKVKGKIFAQFFIKNSNSMITLNCERMTGEFYRSIYSNDITRGYHCPPVQQPYFNTINLSGSVPDSELTAMIDHSYSFVVSKLTKKLRAELESECFSKYIIREMLPSDWARVSQIYSDALKEGKSTFQTVCPEYSEWDNSHIKECRYVAELEENVIGWCAISKTSSREAYRGVVEESIYIDYNYHHIGAGTALLKTLCKNTEQKGYWCVCTSIFSINTASIKLHEKVGFRKIGYREKIAKDKFGQWQDTIMFERRNSIGINK